MEKFKTAKYWVGCDTESARQIMFDFDVVNDRLDYFAYIVAFDEHGNFLDEAQVIFDERNGGAALNFDF